MDARKALAEQIGFLMIANIEQAAHIAQLGEQLKQAQQRLHEAKADERDRSGAVPPPDTLRGS